MRVLLIAVLCVAVARWEMLITYLPADAQSGIGLALVLTAIFGGFASNA